MCLRTTVYREHYARFQKREAISSVYCSEQPDLRQTDHGPETRESHTLTPTIPHAPTTTGTLGTGTLDTCTHSRGVTGRPTTHLVISQG